MKKPKKPNKVTITLTDTPTGVNVAVKFTPAIKREEDATNCHVAAMAAVEAIQDLATAVN